MPIEGKHSLFFLVKTYIGKANDLALVVLLSDRKEMLPAYGICPELAMGPDIKSGSDKFVSPCIRRRKEHLDEPVGPSIFASSTTGPLLTFSGWVLPTVSLFSSLPLVVASSLSKLKVMTPLGTVPMARVSLDSLSSETSEEIDAAANADSFSADTSCNHPENSVNNASRWP